MSKKQLSDTVRPRFKNHHNAHQFDSRIEIIDKKNPSLTVPNQSMTINEIYSRYASGRSLSGVQNPPFDDDGSGKIELTFDDYMPDLNTLDLADRQAIMEDAKQQLDEVKKRLNAVTAAKKQAQAKKEAELQKRIKELEEKQALNSKNSQGRDDSEA